MEARTGLLLQIDDECFGLAFDRKDKIRSLVDLVRLSALSSAVAKPLDIYVDALDHSASLRGRIFKSFRIY